MHIDSSIVQAYISGMDMCQYEKEWFFSSSALDVDRGKNIFTLPPDDDVIREEVNRLEFCFRQGAPFSRLTENTAGDRPDRRFS